EGENTHLFLLTFKDDLDDATETVYDFSSKEKLQSEAQRMATRTKAAPANTSYAKQIPVQPSVTPAIETVNTSDAAVKVDAPAQSTTLAVIQPENKSETTVKVESPVKVETPVQPPSTPVTQAVATDDAPVQAPPPPARQVMNKTDAPALQTTPVIQAVNKIEAKPLPSELDRKYLDLVTLADKAFASRSYGEAGGLYTAALVLRPNDSWSVSRLAAIQSAKDSANKKEWKPEGPVYRTAGKPAVNTEYKPDGPLYRTTAKNNKPSEYKPNGPLYRTKTNNSSGRKANEPLYRPTGKTNTALVNGQTGGGNAVTDQDNPPLIFDDYNIDSIRYEVFIQLADSLAWRVKDHKRALPWYDSALSVKPQASYPKKQIKAIRHLQFEKDLAEARKNRSAAFTAALEDYKKADRLRIERRYEESYKGYKTFLGKIDSPNLKEYNSHDLYYINQAKDWMARLEPHLPKPKVEAPAPVVNEPKSRKKKKRG
ncbi:MAG TPA: hypothetical protein VD996_04460, partial [Chitinophagaceae bacterium]|nr:hypothetical protein [Chitinophagaceae bacterium]